MKLLLVSDVHLDWVTRGRVRFDDLAKAFKAIVPVAIEQKVQRVFFLGDLCDPNRNLSPMRCVELAMSIAIELADHDIPSHWLAGNHDVIEDGSGTTTLTPFRALVASAYYRSHIFLHEEPSISQLGDGWSLLALPFTPLSHAYDPVEWVTHVLNESYPLIVISHLTIEGIVEGEETTEMPRGRSVVLPLKMLTQRQSWTLVFSGHYHQRRVTPEGLRGKDVVIVGSLGSLTFSEEGHENGFLIISDTK